ARTIPRPSGPARRSRRRSRRRLQSFQPVFEPVVTQLGEGQPCAMRVWAFDAPRRAVADDAHVVAAAPPLIDLAGEGQPRATLRLQLPNVLEQLAIHRLRARL